MSHSFSSTCTIHKQKIQTDFTMFKNEIWENPYLSWAAKGLLGYLLSRPDDWIVHLWQLKEIYEGNKRGNGKEAIWAIMKELRNAGYVVYVKFKDKKGHWKNRYDVYPYPVKEEIKEISPHPAEPCPAEPCPVKAGTLPSNELPSNELKENDYVVKENVVVVSDFKDVIAKITAYLAKFVEEFGPHWNLSKEVLKDLMKSYGEKYVIDQLNYMTKQQQQAAKDEKNAYSKRKSPKIDKPETYLKIACEKNYAKSIQNSD